VFAPGCLKMRMNTPREPFDAHDLVLVGSAVLDFGGRPLRARSRCFGRRPPSSARADDDFGERTRLQELRCGEDVVVAVTGAQAAARRRRFDVRTAPHEIHDAESTRAQRVAVALTSILARFAAAHAGARDAGMVSNCGSIVLYARS